MRLFLLSKQYRKPIDFSDGALRESTTALDRIYALLQRIERESGPAEEATEGGDLSGGYWQQFCEAMNDDFNTARALAVVFDTVRHTNRHLNKKEGVADVPASEFLENARHAIHEMGKVLGLLNHSPQDYFSEKITSHMQEQAIDTVTVEGMLEEREAARRDKDWKKADEIRDRLAALHVVIEDRPDGTVWKIEK